MNDLQLQEYDLLDKVRNENNDAQHWQMAIELGKVAMEKIENMQWFMGDLAIVVTERWGKDALGEFATHVGVSKNTLLRYAIVSMAFPPEKREPRLSHRHHFILASRVDRFEILDKIKDRENVSSENLTRLLKKADGKIDDDIASIRVLLSVGEIERTMKWYSLLEKYLGDKLTQSDHELHERYKMNLAKLKHLVQNNHAEDL